MRARAELVCSRRVNDELRNDRRKQECFHLADDYAALLACVEHAGAEKLLFLVLTDAARYTSKYYKFSLSLAVTWPNTLG